MSEHTAENGLLTFNDPDALRDHLDALNEAGTDDRAAGMDALGQPFLIALDGCYAETEVVLFGNPWDTEVDYGTGPACGECMAQRPHRMHRLRFPVRVIPPAKSEGADR